MSKIKHFLHKTQQFDMRHIAPKERFRIMNQCTKPFIEQKFVLECQKLKRKHDPHWKWVGGFRDEESNHCWISQHFGNEKLRNDDILDANKIIIEELYSIFLGKMNNTKWVFAVYESDEFMCRSYKPLKALEGKLVVYADRYIDFVINRAKMSEYFILP